MRRASAIVMSGALGVALVGIAAPAAHAAPVEGSFEVVEWETQASCRNHGAPSPVVTYTVPSAVTSWRNILFAVDDQSGYARTALQELSLIHISEPTRRLRGSRMPSSA